MAGRPTGAGSAPTVDVHTHMYPPAYVELLKARTQVPYIHVPAPTEEAPNPDPRLIILPSDDDETVPQDERGRPVDASYSDVAAKLRFMDAHGIAASVVSLANPWLDWLPVAEAAPTARRINDSVEHMCERHPGRLFHFGTLPLSGTPEEIAAEVRHLVHLPLCKGVVIGTSGLGLGLDDWEMETVWKCLAESGLMVFVHPHYGLPAEVFGGAVNVGRSGHVLPLALGFPLETTVAFVRMYVAGVFERHPLLKLLLAHAGGTVPFLAGRVESCMFHERKFRDENGRVTPMRSIWDVLKTNVWLDGVVYSTAGVHAASQVVGSDRVLWGTDHPFFPPIGEEEGDEIWTSVSMNEDAVYHAFEDNDDAVKGVLGENAIKVLGLDLSRRT